MDPLLWWGLGLLGLSLVLLALELIIPSAGIITVAAAATAIAGVVCLWRHNEVLGIVSMLTVLVMGPVLFFVGLHLWQHTPMGRKVIGVRPEEEIEAERQREVEERQQRLGLVGAEGIALTDLRPVGVVEIDHRRHDALADTTYVPRGARVRVVGVDAVQVRVREATSGPANDANQPNAG